MRNGEVMHTQKILDKGKLSSKVLTMKFMQRRGENQDESMDIDNSSGIESQDAHIYNQNIVNAHSSVKWSLFKPKKEEELWDPTEFHSNKLANLLANCKGIPTKAKTPKIQKEEIEEKIHTNEGNKSRDGKKKKKQIGTMNQILQNDNPWGNVKEKKPLKKNKIKYHNECTEEFPAHFGKDPFMKKLQKRKKCEKKSSGEKRTFDVDDTDEVFQPKRFKFFDE